MQAEAKEASMSLGMPTRIRTSRARRPANSFAAREGAFTLVELLISVAVLSILAGMAAQTFKTVLEAREIAVNRLERNETARTALDFLSSELRTAYLTPDSVKPLLPSGLNTANQTAPRFRFAGLFRDLESKNYTEIPGAGKDDDGDGDKDEEALDGIDNDNDGLIDEDLGEIPSDMLHFVTAVENSGDIILTEVSYGLDPSGTRLVRRSQNLSLGSSSANNQRELADFGQFIDNQTQEPLVPPPLVVGQVQSPQMVNRTVANWDKGSELGSLTGNSTVLANNSPAKIFEVLAYDIRGLRVHYWYFDYNRGGWRWTPEWDSARETALVPPSQRIFNAPAANNSIEGNTRLSFANVIVNELDDMYPREPFNLQRFQVSDPTTIMSDDQYKNVLERMIKRTDGLPNLVEITIWVQDRKRQEIPMPYTTRVFIPNNYRSIGLG
ncbi:MAG: prepilin-type N-terminal cleavage/methylation domain-containing protein [bacterium]|nr:prepilin-type N-terminal cleavage/methylation domain-containing protein [bacterium]